MANRFTIISYVLSYNRRKVLPHGQVDRKCSIQIVETMTNWDAIRTILWLLYRLIDITKKRKRKIKKEQVTILRPGKNIFETVFKGQLLSFLG